MNNLTPRKIVLGLLMTLVLAFSVQDIAEAQVTVTRRSSDDLEMRDVGDRDLFRVSISVAGTTADNDTLDIPIAPEGNLTIKKIDNDTIPAGITGTNITLVEDFDSATNESYERLSTSHTIDYAVDSDATPGDTDITIGGVIFTVFVVDDAATTTATGISLDDGEYDVRGNQDSSIATTIAGNTSPSVPVTYSVSGGGRVYVEEGDRQTSATTSLTTSTDATVNLRMNSRTNKVTVTIQGLDSDTTTYIYGNPRLQKVSGTGQMGVAGGRLEDPLVVKLVDFGGRSVSGIPVNFSATDDAGAFMAVPGETLYLSDGELRTATTTRGPTIPSRAYTDSGGEATIYYEFASDATRVVAVTAVVRDTSASTIFQPEVEDTTRRPTLDILSGNNQRTDKNGDLEFPLVVVVRQAGKLKPGEVVTFRTVKGTLTSPSTVEDDNGPGKRVRHTTEGSGEAQATYYQDPGAGSDTVTATISGGNYEREVVFGIDGGRTTDGGTRDTRDDEDDEDDEDDDTTTGRTITINPTSLTGRPGVVVPFGALARTGTTDTPVTITGSATFTAAGGLVSGTGALRNVTLPNTVGTYSLTVSATGYDDRTVPVTVSGTAPAPAGTGTLSITLVGARVGTQQQIRVSVQNSDLTSFAGALNVPLTGATNPSTVSTLNGTGTVVVTLPTATEAHTLTVSATGYGTDSATVPAVSEQGGSEQPSGPTPRVPAGTPSSIRIASEPFPSGTANRQLAQPLRVQVLDANNRGVASVRVTFEVVSGQGRLSQRGNGRAIRAQTDPNGNASANYTPLADGTSRVRATAAGVTQTVTFTITAGAAAPSRDDTTPSDTGVTPSREINPDVHVRAAQRPPMLWVDGGKIYALVGADVEEFSSGVEGAMNIAVGGRKVYWTEMTGESSGTINSAKLDGSDVKELKKIKAVPMGIAVDTAGGKLYWTNSRGRIQSADIDGSGIENVMLDLPGPMDIAVARGILYWTQYDETDGEGNVGIANATGRGTPKYISTGADAPGSIAIAGNTVYWTEMTGSESGTINSANLNGSGATELNDIRAVPMGIGVDTARSKLYWTNSRGRVQSANLEGRKIQNVVDGLGNPGDMVLSNSISAPAKAPTTASDSNKYDVNEDGVVDGKDKVLVLEAVMEGTYVAKYDVNNDKKLDILDYVLVDVEADGGAAGAPALLGMKMSAVQIDRLQEQIDLLIASGDRSPDTMRILTYLQQLIVMARPEKTQLLANYPNPFNPETWIPYELATDTTVKITIYNTQGVVIRTLELGHQSAGYYTGRDRAAYWDGRNALGEQVASGIYFYQFETDEISSMRKMVILK